MQYFLELYAGIICKCLYHFVNLGFIVYVLSLVRQLKVLHPIQPSLSNIGQLRMKVFYADEAALN